MNGEITSIDCNACKSEQTMHATKIGRFSGIVRVIGYIFVIPSVIGIVYSIIMMFLAAGRVGGMDADAEVAAADLLPKN